MDHDIIIIGAGVIGTSVANYIKKIMPNARVLLLERGKRVATGNTGRSAALYRNIFSSVTSRTLATSSISYYSGISDIVHLDPIGYLWFFSTTTWEGAKAALRNLDPITDQVEFIMGEEIHRRININTQGRITFPDIYAGMLGHMCGSISAMSLARHYFDEFTLAGGEAMFSTEVTGFLLSGEESGYAPWDNIHVIGVRTADGETITARQIIVAVGAWSHELLSPLGVFSSVLPKKRQLFAVKVDDPSILVPEGRSFRMPALILPAGDIYIKPILKHGIILVGASNDLGEPFSMADPEPNLEYFSRAIAPALNHYFPELWAPKLLRSWAGYYAYHWPDKNPVVESISNLTWVSGTSGSGIMKADAIGRVVAARINGDQEAMLADGQSIKVRDFSLIAREVGSESFIL